MPHLRCYLAAALLAAPAAWAAPKHTAPAKKAEAKPAPGPKALGTFGSWTAATYEQGGHTVCYAFTRPQAADAKAAADAPLLTVTERPTSRDEVAVTHKAAFPKDAKFNLQVGATTIDMFTSGHNAFARDPKAAVAAFKAGAQAVGHEGKSSETYSLDGFTSAYGAIVKACPAH